MSDTEPTAAEPVAAESPAGSTGEESATAAAEAPAAEPVQNRAARRAKPVKQAKPQHVGPRQDRRGKH